MKRGFIQSLYKKAIKYKDYLPVRDGEENIRGNDKVSTLVKDFMGTITFLEFIDADALSPEEIKQHLEDSAFRLLNLPGRGGYVTAEVFIFNSQPDEAKINAIRSGQMSRTFAKRFVKCLSIDLSTQKVTKHYKALGDFGMGRLVKMQFDGSVSGDTANEPLEEILLKKEMEYQVEYKAKRPAVTYVLIAIDILVWLGLTFLASQSGVRYDDLLIPFGAKENGLILKGEYWRFITPIFLHGDLMHLALNCYFLYAVSVSEKIYGHLKFIVIYILAGILGNVASFAFLSSPGVGASGANFGLLGAMLYFGIQKPAIFRGKLGYNILFVIVINLVYGFSRPGIDNAAHIGGLIGGFLVCGAIGGSSGREWSPPAVPAARLRNLYQSRLVYIPLALLITAGTVFYGFNNDRNKITSMISRLEQYSSSQNWSAAEKTAEEILALDPSDERIKGAVLWELSRVEFLSGKAEEALEHGKQLVQVSPKDGHYLLGILYYSMEQLEPAYEELQEAKRIGADHENIDKYLREIGEALGK